MEEQNANHSAGTGEFDFFGQGSKYFGIVVVNFLLTVLSLGLYYPWAKERSRKYLWSETEFEGSAFSFHGTGKEMFRGFVIAYGIIVGLLIIAAFVPFFFIVFILGMAILFPLALFGAWRYRVTRTSWRGIYFTFDGNFTEFLNLFVVQSLLTLVTFGLYGSWMRVKLQKYLFSHTRFGQLQLGFNGDGLDLFVINLGALLITPTLGIYYPFYVRNRFNFTANYTYLTDGNQKANVYSHLRGSTAFETLLGNAFIIVFTLGLGAPWAMMRKLKMYFEHLEMPDAFDYDALEQQEGAYHDATGDEMADILDVGLDF